MKGKKIFLLTFWRLWFHSNFDFLSIFIRFTNQSIFFQKNNTSNFIFFLSFAILNFSSRRDLVFQSFILYFFTKLFFFFLQNRCINNKESESFFLRSINFALSFSLGSAFKVCFNTAKSFTTEGSVWFSSK